MTLLEIAEMYAQTLEEELSDLTNFHAHLFTDCGNDCPTLERIMILKKKIYSVQEAIRNSKSSTVK